MHHLVNVQPSTAQDEEPTALAIMTPILMMSLFVVIMPLPTMATAGGGAAAGVIPSTLQSYGHLLVLLGMMCMVVAQKVLVQPNMTKDDEGSVGMLNIACSLALALLLVSGYFRVVEFGKASFYSHEITFWIKMAFTGVQGGLALFKTIALVKRGMDGNSSTFEPMSDT